MTDWTLFAKVCVHLKSLQLLWQCSVCDLWLNYGVGMLFAVSLAYVCYIFGYGYL